MNTFSELNTSQDSDFEAWDDTIRFFLNGEKVILENPDPDGTLLDWIRNKANLTGLSKLHFQFILYI